MKTYAIHRVDGGVEIMYTNTDPVKCVAKWHPSRKAEITGVIEEISGVPADRTFRNAWRCVSGSITHDLAACRELHRARIRTVRRAKFAHWDGEWMKCTAVGDAVGAAAAEAKRQELRDAPAYPSIDAATTPEELKVAIPDCLK